MTDCMNEGKNSHLSINTNASSVFNRSMTAYAPSVAAVAVAGEEKHPQFNGKVRKLCSVFDSPKNNQSNSFDPEFPPSLCPLECSSVRLPGTEDRVVIYFTSLRGIRRTFQDCQSVRMIFRGFRVNIDERDVSMDVEYKKEMQELFGEKVRLPQVFIKGRHIGGAELIMNLVEEGELVRMLKGLPLKPLKPCDVCDDVRFIACVNCGGSRKVFDEDKEQINSCPVCNENGLMRCPLCTS